VTIKSFDPRLRLIIQASIPVPTAAHGQAEYENLKIFLLAISPDITLNGQLMSMLEPCCKKKPKQGEKPDDTT